MYCALPRSSDIETELKETQESMTAVTRERDIYKAALQHIALGTWNKTIAGGVGRSPRQYAKHILAQVKGDE